MKKILISLAIIAAISAILVGATTAFLATQKLQPATLSQLEPLI